MTGPAELHLAGETGLIAGNTVFLVASYCDVHVGGGGWVADVAKPSQVARIAFYTSTRLCRPELIMNYKADIITRIRFYLVVGFYFRYIAVAHRDIHSTAARRELFRTQFKTFCVNSPQGLVIRFVPMCKNESTMHNPDRI